MAVDHIEHTIRYKRFTTEADLSKNHRMILSAAFEASHLAYAPYSNFRVGAAAKLDTGEIVHASNKENASFPAGICAERNLINYVSDQHPKSKIEIISVVANPVDIELNQPVTPCGVCRQVMCETERNQMQSIEVILKGGSSDILLFEKASLLLPLDFYLQELKK